MTKSKNKITENSPKETKIRQSKKKIIIISLIFLLLLMLFPFVNKNNKVEEKAANENASKKAAVEFVKEGELTFVKNSGGFISQINIEIAGDETERTQGLMYRDKMKENEGMFFIFDFETAQSFWMKNTLISLDIIFINKENKIVKIHKNTETLSENSYPSGKPAIYVVEVVAGYTDKFGINEGDKIVWRRM